MSAATVLHAFRAWLTDEAANTSDVWPGIALAKLAALEAVDGRQDAVSMDFETFWRAYPRKTAKAAALKAWRKLDPPPMLFAEIMAALAAQCRQVAWLRDDGAYVPHAATWLNGRRWEDDLTGLPTVAPVAESRAAEDRRAAETLARRMALRNGGPS